MFDYKKAEQAKKLLEESGVDYTLAYVDENNVVIGNVQGSALKATDCAIAIMQAIKRGDKAAVATLRDRQ